MQPILRGLDQPLGVMFNIPIVGHSAPSGLTEIVCEY
jgi:hypothetical protein